MQSRYLALISTFQFIVSLVITRNIFDLTLPVTQLLQAKSNDIMDGIDLIQALKNLGIIVRTQIDFYHVKWYQEALVLAGKVNIEEAVPRTVARQTSRDNHPFSTPSEKSDYYSSVRPPKLQFEKTI